MIPFDYRFHGHNSLSYVYQHGQSQRSSSLTFKYLQNKYRKKSRISVVISKKITKSAVERNRIRRRIYNIVRLYLKQFKLTVDLVIIINNNDINKMPYLDLKNKIEQFFISIKLI